VSVEATDRQDFPKSISRESSFHEVIETLRRSPASPLIGTRSLSSDAFGSRSLDSVKEVREEEEQPDSEAENTSNSSRYSRNVRARSILKATKKLPQLKTIKIEEETEVDLQNEQEQVTEGGLLPEAVQAQDQTNLSKVLPSPFKAVRRKSKSSVPPKKTTTGSKLKRRRVKSDSEANESTITESPSEVVSDTKDASAIEEDPRAFYARKRRQSIVASGQVLPKRDEASISSLATTESRDPLGSSASIYRSSNLSSMYGLGENYTSTDSISSRGGAFGRDKAPTPVNETLYQTYTDQAGVFAAKTLNQALQAAGFMSSGHPSLYDVTHDKNHRTNIYTDIERFRYSTFNDPGILYDLFTELPVDDPEILEQEKDPQAEIDKLNVTIKQATAPVPANFKRRGQLLCKLGKYDEALSDLDRALLLGELFPEFEENRILKS
jgi:hypothetical protein